MLMSRLRALFPASLLALISTAAVVACSDEGDGNGFQTGDDLVLTIDPTQVVFSSVNVGESVERVVRLRHGGLRGTLRLRNLRFETESADLTVTDPEKADLQPGEETTLKVTYAPGDAVPDSGEILIDTNVPDPSGGAVVAAGDESVNCEWTL